MRFGDKMKASHIENHIRNNALLMPMPIVEICGNERVLIENHRGIIAYGYNEIRIKSRIGCICVCGSQLRLSRMSNTKLVITGKICNVTLQGRTGNDI